MYQTAPHYYEQSQQVSHHTEQIVGIYLTHSRATTHILHATTVLRHRHTLVFRHEVDARCARQSHQMAVIVLLHQGKGPRGDELARPRKAAR
jgi:hypothetical protein